MGRPELPDDRQDRLRHPRQLRDPRLRLRQVVFPPSLPGLSRPDPRLLFRRLPALDAPRVDPVQRGRRDPFLPALPGHLAPPAAFLPGDGLPLLPAAVALLPEHGLDGGSLPPLHARRDRVLRKGQDRVGLRDGGARDAHEDSRHPDRRRVRPDPDPAEALALAPLDARSAVALAGFFAFCWSRTGNFFEYFAQQGDKAAAFRPFGFMPHFFELGLYHQVEYFILLAFVYGVGISRIRKYETIFVYSALQFLLHINMSTEEWPRYWLVMAPFALVVGYHDIWEARETKWLFAIPVVMGFVYCWGAIPLNGILPAYWKLALAQLGLLGEWTPP